MTRGMGLLASVAWWAEVVSVYLVCLDAPGLLRLALSPFASDHPLAWWSDSFVEAGSGRVTLPFLQADYLVALVLFGMGVYLSVLARRLMARWTPLKSALLCWAHFLFVLLLLNSYIQAASGDGVNGFIVLLAIDLSWGFVCIKLLVPPSGQASLEPNPVIRQPKGGGSE